MRILLQDWAGAQIQLHPLHLPSNGSVTNLSIAQLSGRQTRWYYQDGATCPLAESSVKRLRVREGLLVKKHGSGRSTEISACGLLGKNDLWGASSEQGVGEYGKEVPSLRGVGELPGPEWDPRDEGASELAR